MNRKNVFLTAVLTAGLLAGCASVAVTEDAIKQKTAFALGLNQGDFAISNRVDDGVETRYSVKTKTGKTYNCYVTGTVTVLGRTVSDAICSTAGKGSKTGSTGTQCNALLKAANKCE